MLDDLNPTATAKCYGLSIYLVGVIDLVLHTWNNLCLLTDCLVSWNTINLTIDCGPPLDLNC